MKLSTSALLLGATASTAFAADQQVLGGSGSAPQKPDFIMPSKDADDSQKEAPGFSMPSSIKELLDSVGDEASKLLESVWSEVEAIVPNPETIKDDVLAAIKANMDGASALPKPHNRRPDSHWDYHVKGADVQSVWAEGETEDAPKHRKVGGKLDSYNLRAKKVDPSKLGVDKVKQYSGYLDDDENDKHLFYCESWLAA